jgi:hypothetical protein
MLATETPRTDEESSFAMEGVTSGTYDYFVAFLLMRNLARELESELNQRASESK